MYENNCITLPFYLVYVLNTIALYILESRIIWHMFWTQYHYILTALYLVYVLNTISLYIEQPYIWHMFWTQYHYILNSSISGICFEHKIIIYWTSLYLIYMFWTQYHYILNSPIIWYMFWTQYHYILNTPISGIWFEHNIIIYWTLLYLVYVLNIKSL